MKRATVDKRRAEILDATCDVVIERGFAGTRIGDVARRLGISTGLVHYHFDSKDQLLAEAFQHAVRADLNQLAEELAALDRPVDRLARIIERISPENVDSTWVLWIDGWGEALRTETMRAISEELDATYTGIIEQTIRDGVAAAVFRCDDPSAAAWRIGALIDGLGVQATVHPGVVTREQMMRWVQEATCRELGLADGTFG